MNTRIAILSSAIALAAGGVAWGGPGAEVGDKAPPLSAGGWVNLPEGMKSLAAKDLAGQILFVEFWATW